MFRNGECGPALEYNSALKRKDIPTLATTWMSLEDMVLNEISQTQKENTV
jgi:hypothetical protein